MATEQDPTHPTGVRVTSGGEGQATKARQRKEDAALALKLNEEDDLVSGLKLSGYDWGEIARILGFPSPKHALTAYEKALQRNLHESDTSVAKMRDLTGRRMERLLRAVWAKAIDPDHPDQMAAHDRARAVLIDHARLFGLNAPTEMVVSTPSASELHNFVSRVVSAENAGLEEDDILDADVIEDEQREIGA
jgi:hypothetical protein